MTVNRSVIQEIAKSLAERGSALSVALPEEPGWDEFYAALRAEHPDLWERLVRSVKSGYKGHEDEQKSASRSRARLRRLKQLLGMERDPTTGELVTSRPKLMVPVALGALLLTGTLLYNVFKPLPHRGPVRVQTAQLTQVPAPPSPVETAPPPLPQQPATAKPKRPAPKVEKPSKPARDGPLPTAPPEEVQPIPYQKTPVMVQQPAPPPSLRVQRAEPLPEPPTAASPPPTPDRQAEVASNRSDAAPFTLVSLSDTPESPPDTPPAPPGAVGTASAEADPFTLDSATSQAVQGSAPGDPQTPPGVQVGHFYQATLLGDLVLTEGGKMLAVLASGSTVWQGEASIGPSKRVEVRLKAVTAGGRTYPVQGVAFGVSGDRRSVGLEAAYSDEAPTLVADALRSAIAGVGRFVDLKNSAGTVVVSGGTVVQGQNEPDLLANVGGSLADLLKLPTNQAALVRVGKVSQGIPVHLFVTGFGGEQ